MNILLLVLLVVIDQVTKYIALTRLKPVVSIPVIDGFFSFTFVENTGAAFGIFAGMRWFFVVTTIIILFVMLTYYKRLPKEKPYNYLRFFVIIVASGAIGNFIDRLMRGYVVDFLHLTFINFPVFNVADCYVCVGAAALVFLFLFVVKE